MECKVSKEYNGKLELPSLGVTVAFEHKSPEQVIQLHTELIAAASTIRASLSHDEPKRETSSGVRCYSTIKEEDVFNYIREHEGKACPKAMSEHFKVHITTMSSNLRRIIGRNNQLQRRRGSGREYEYYIVDTVES